MRNVSTFTIVLPLLAAALLTGFRHFGARDGLTPGSPAYDVPTVEPELSVNELKDRGVLRVAAPRGTPSLFLEQGVPRGFEYGLLRRFARHLGVELRVRTAPSAEAIADHLYDGSVDVAVLPWIGVHVDGAVRAAPHLKRGLASAPGGPRYPPTGALFVREDSPSLVAKLNRFIERSRRDGTIKVLYERAFDPPRPDDSTRISRWDDLIRRSTNDTSFDWRFVVALIVQESRFDPEAVSDKGALGLMQLTPIAARAVGIVDVEDPASNIRAGIRYLEQLSRMFPAADGRHRRAIILAAYLVGPAHVRDAQEIARQLGVDPHRWENALQQAIVLLEEPTWYRQAEHGFSPGTQAVRYVDEVLRRYRLYQELVPAGDPPG